MVGRFEFHTKWLILFSKLRVKIAVNRIWHANLSFTDYILITRYHIGSILSSFWAIARFIPRLNIWLHIKLNASLLLKWSQILLIYKTARKLYIFFFAPTNFMNSFFIIFCWRKFNEFSSRNNFQDSLVTLYGAGFFYFWFHLRFWNVNNKKERIAQQSGRVESQYRFFCCQNGFHWISSPYNLKESLSSCLHI